MIYTNFSCRAFSGLAWANLGWDGQMSEKQIIAEWTEALARDQAELANLDREEVVIYRDGVDIKADMINALRYMIEARKKSISILKGTSDSGG
jgi:hypothetical protein